MKGKSMKTLLCIDGNSILNRAFYGIRALSTKDGTPTNALYGMINIFSKQIEEYKPDFAAVAFDLGVSPAQIKNAVARLTPPAHRLALVPSSNALTIIDDAYNGSVEGAKAALDVLAKFSGQKIVITPGLVELGKDEFNSNFELGRQMAAVATYVIIDGVVNYDALAGGLEFGGFDMTKVLRAGSLSQAVEVLNSVANPGDVVLFENDLPDNYT